MSLYFHLPAFTSTARLLIFVFLSTIKDMSGCRGWSGATAQIQGSGIGSKIVSVPIAITNSNTYGSSIAACFKLWTTTFERRTIKQQATFELISFELISFELISFELISFELISFELISFELISFELISFELISTETAHVRDLQIIVEAFFSSTQSMLTEKANTIIFANIQNALSTLESCFEALTDGFQHRTDTISRATKTSRCETDSLEKSCSLPAHGSRSSIAQNAVGDRVDEKLSQCPAQQCCVARRA
ncbi:hypothetical protein NDA13_005483 [Ustilago tritici]|nr:hypothetical protein NDA13_005483 [Ustilago tritici]